MCVFEIRHCNIRHSVLFTVYELHKQKCMLLDMRKKCPMKNVLLENTWNCGESCNGALQCMDLSSSKAYSRYFFARDVDDNQLRITSTSQRIQTFPVKLFVVYLKTQYFGLHNMELRDE